MQYIVILMVILSTKQNDGRQVRPASYQHLHVESPIEIVDKKDKISKVFAGFHRYTKFPEKIEINETDVTKARALSDDDDGKGNEGTNLFSNNTISVNNGFNETNTTNSKNTTKSLILNIAFINHTDHDLNKTTTKQPDGRSKQHEFMSKLGELEKQLDQFKNAEKEANMFSQNVKECEKGNQAIEKHLASLAQIAAQQQSLVTEQENALKEQEEAVYALINGKLISEFAMQERNNLSSFEVQADILNSKVGAERKIMSTLKEQYPKLESPTNNTGISAELKNISLSEDEKLLSNEQKELILKLGELEKRVDHSETIGKQREYLLQNLKVCKIKNQTMEEQLTSLEQIVEQQRGLIVQQEKALRNQESQVSSLMREKGQELISKLAIQGGEGITSDAKGGVNGTKMKAVQDDDTAIGARKTVVEPQQKSLPEEKNSFVEEQSDLKLKIGDLQKQLRTLKIPKEGSMGMKLYREYLEEEIKKREEKLKDLENKNKDLLPNFSTDKGNVDLQFIMINKAQMKLLKNSIPPAAKTTFTNLDGKMLRMIENAVKIQDKVKSQEDKIASEREQISHVHDLLEDANLPRAGLPRGAIPPTPSVISQKPSDIPIIILS